MAVTTLGAGVLGATVAALATFLPCYLCTIVPAPYFKKHGKRPGIVAFVDGVTAAAIGAIAGACIVLAQRFDPSTAVDAIREHGVTVVPGAPPLWQAFASLDHIPADAFAGVRLALSGAAKLPDAVAQVMADRFGVTVREGYGLTEASPVVTTSVGIEARRGSVGKVVDDLIIEDTQMWERACRRLAEAGVAEAAESPMTPS